MYSTVGSKKYLQLISGRMKIAVQYELNIYDNAHDLSVQLNGHKKEYSISAHIQKDL